jgi:hypothetical protein
MTKQRTVLTPEQKEELKAKYHSVAANGTPYGFMTKLANEYGIAIRTAQQIIFGRKKRGDEDLPEHLRDDGMFVKGRSVLLDSEGNVKLQWVKTDKKFDAEMMKGIITDLCEQLPSLPPVPYENKKFKNSDLLTVYPMGDPHFGLYAWDEETEGGDFDLAIAERDLCEAMDRLVSSSPPSENALIINLGDFFEADNMQGITMRSGHKLDTDTRWLKVLRTGIRALIRCVQSALMKHKNVTVICAIGNHDDHSSMFLMTILSHLFEKEKRLTIYDAPTIKHYFHWESILIGVHHGHTIKMSELAKQMPYDRPQEFANSKHRYWWTGHIHQDRKLEDQGVLIESARTLAARNAWAASMGYRSGRDAKAVVYHKDFGEVERHTVSVDMLAAERSKKK